MKIFKRFKKNKNNIELTVLIDVSSENIKTWKNLKIEYKDGKIKFPKFICPSVNAGIFSKYNKLKNNKIHL